MSSSTTSSSSSSSSSSSAFPRCPSKRSWLYGGRQYDRVADRVRFMRDFQALIWVTYRKNFIELTAKSRLKSDGGWGCMLRSAQMLLANVLCQHIRDVDELEVLSWFIDSPHIGCPYSIHAMVQHGLLRGKQPGEWYGPQTVSHVLREMVAAHEERTGRPSLMVLVADEGTIYTDDVYKMCSAHTPSLTDAANSNADAVASNNKDASHVSGEGKSDSFDPLLHMSPDDEAQWRAQREPWERGLLILIPVRLGLDKINECYAAELEQVFQMPQSVGVIGGSPRHSVYFVGSEGSRLLYLDPHTVQEAPKRGAKFPTSKEFRSYHSSTPRTMPISGVDPSLAFAFYLRDRDDFEDFCARVVQAPHADNPAFTIARTRPDYQEDDCALCDDGLDFDDDLQRGSGGAAVSVGGADSKGDDGDDDSDYVFL